MKTILPESLSPCKIPFTILLCSANMATVLLPLRKPSEISARYPCLLSLRIIVSNTFRNSLRCFANCDLICNSSLEAVSFIKPLGSMTSLKIVGISFSKFTFSSSKAKCLKRPLFFSNQFKMERIHKVNSQIAINCSTLNAALGIPSSFNSFLMFFVKSLGI